MAAITVAAAPADVATATDVKRHSKLYTAGLVTANVVHLSCLVGGLYLLLRPTTLCVGKEKYGAACAAYRRFGNTLIATFVCAVIVRLYIVVHRWADDVATRVALVTANVVHVSCLVFGLSLRLTPTDVCPGGALYYSEACVKGSSDKSWGADFIITFVFIVFGRLCAAVYQWHRLRRAAAAASRVQQQQPTTWSESPLTTAAHLSERAK